MAEKRMSRWYFGGIASCGAACCTHPLDLLKVLNAQVHLQTQQEVKMRMVGMAMHVVKNDGVLALYNGLSASLCRQMSYSLTRFAIYETLIWPSLSLFHVIDLHRMQNDMKLPAEQRRNYKHALDGLFRVWREEGTRKLFSGATMASSRGALVTVGQLACYDQAKQLVLGTGLMGDNILTHFLSSFIAGVIHCLTETAKLGPLAFYKGLVPAGIRLIPHTVLTFVFLEQLKKYFGIRVLS
ncbi:hypothetical protein cypCar_00029960 [Cyprinus carpio]|nr:hypothetical protein cypCar_00029960 [Cyprinus carpio]